MARRRKPIGGDPPAGFFTNGEELPLFTQTPARAQESPFDPQPQPRQLALDGIRPRLTFEELAELKRQGRIK